MSENFNELSPGETERLAILAEECSEVIQIVGKILRHGYHSTHPDGGPTNRKLLEKEIGHVEFAVARLSANKDVNKKNIQTSGVKKCFSAARYLHHQNISYRNGVPKYALETVNAGQDGNK